MYRASFDYNGEFPGSLSIKTDEKFLVLRKENEYWFLVARPDGLLGCVPVNYLEELKENSSEINQILAESINNALKSLNQEEASVIHHRDDIIRELLDRRDHELKSEDSSSRLIEENSGDKSSDVSDNQVKRRSNHSTNSKSGSHRKSRRAPPAPPARTDCSNSAISAPTVTNTLHDTSLKDERHHSPAADVQMRHKDTASEEAMAPSPPGSVPPGLGFHLVEALRVGTGATYTRCLRTLRVLLDTLTEGLPDVRMWTDAIENQLEEDENSESKRASYLETTDWAVMGDLFEYFEERTNDSQERSWSLHENEMVLAQKLEQLVATLESADGGLVRTRFREDKFHSVTSFIQLFQMERRVKLRRLLLRVFAISCEVEPQTVPVFLYSVLPLEIIRDLADKTTDYTNCSLSLTVLTILIGISEQLPAEITEKFTVSYLCLLLSRMSQQQQNGDSTYNGSSARLSHLEQEEDHSPGQGGATGEAELSSAVTGLLLAYNRHLEDPRTNPLMECLRSSQNLARHFTECVIQAFNRGDDPAVVITDDAWYRIRDSPATSRPDNSVRKLLCDIYANEDTADLIYRNDAEVIIDVIIRQMCDLPPNSPDLSEYLVLLDLILTHSDYLTRGGYKSKELVQSLRQLASSEDDESCSADRDISRSLLAKISKL